MGLREQASTLVIENQRRCGTCVWIDGLDDDDMAALNDLLAKAERAESFTDADGRRARWNKRRVYGLCEPLGLDVSYRTFLTHTLGQCSG